MEYHYLQVNYDGSIFQYSKDKKEGFVEHTNTKGTVSYRRYFNKGVDGILENIKIQENKYKHDAEELIIELVNGEVQYNLIFPVLNQDMASIDDFTEAFITLLPQLKNGETYNINNWYMKKGDVINGDTVKYNRRGVTVKHSGEKIKSNMTFEYIKGRGTDQEKHVEGDIPMLEWKEIAGKNRPTAVSKEKRLEYLYTILETEVKRLGSDEPRREPKKDVKKPVSTSQANTIDDDDLPF